MPGLSSVVHAPRRALGLLAAVIVATLIAETNPASAAISPLERDMLQLINEERVERHRGRLQMRWYLASNAQAQSRAQAEAGYWFHNEHLSQQLYDEVWTRIGENVGTHSTVRRMHRWFMHSPPHRANILSRDYDFIGIGIVRSDGWLWFTQVFTGS